MEMEMNTQTQAKCDEDENESTLQWKQIANQHKHQSVRKA
jgi:hypothetical protein